MTDLPDPESGLDAVRGAQAALDGSDVPDARVLQAVEAGLLSVSAGSMSWVDVPHQHPSKNT